LGQGEQLLDIEVDGVRCRCVRLATPVPDDRVPLSPREQEITRMVAKGRTNQAIADVLGISAWTVSTHLRRIFTKLGVNSRAAMVATVLDAERWLPAGRQPQPGWPEPVSSVRATPVDATSVKATSDEATSVKATHVEASSEDATHVRVSSEAVTTSVRRNAVRYGVT
jgi:DNA-binding CsgD family transcriptional regulator